jgi:putative peptidoglycan lipid II flippase
MTDLEPMAAPIEDPGRSFARANLVVATGTALSRLSGFARFVVIAAVLGQGDLSDAYNVGNLMPNIVYEMLLGGVLTASLVPLLVRLIEEDDRPGISALSTVILCSSVALGVVATVASPAIAVLTASDHIRHQVQTLAYFLLPEITFYGITTLATSLLNAQRRFFLAAFAPLLNNFVVIVVFVMAARRYTFFSDFKAGTPSYSAMAFIGLGTTLGIVAMSAALVPGITGLLRSLRPRLDISSHAVRELVRLAPWSVGYVVANQMSFLIVLRLAQRQNGGASAYNNAFNFFVLPHALLAVSLVTTFTPNLASIARTGRWRRYSGRLTFGMKLMVFLIAPASALMAVLARPLLSLVQRRNFDASDAALAGRVLAAFAIGLVGFSLYLFVLRGFYAVQDARTPFYINAVENIINIVLAFILVGRYGVVGLALSYSIAYLVSAGIAIVVLNQRFPLDLPRLNWWGLRISAASAWCALVAWQVGRRVGSNQPLAGAVTRLTVAGLAGSVAYVAVMLFLGALDRRPPSDQQPQPIRPPAGLRPRVHQRRPHHPVGMR